MISFEELIPGAVSVRYTIINDIPYLSIRDLIMVVCDQNQDRAGKTWRNLPYKIELQQWLRSFQFPGRGQSSQPVTALPGALKIIMWLPGTMAKGFRSKACDILERHLSGDPTLTMQTAHNAAIGVVAACEEFLTQAMTSAKRLREADTDVSYVYCTESDAFPNLRKIGRTGDLASRLNSLNTGCAPLPHRYVAVAPTYHPVRDEKMALAYFDDVREEGEFIRASVASVQAFFDRYITPEYNDECLARSRA